MRSASSSDAPAHGDPRRTPKLVRGSQHEGHGHSLPLLIDASYYLGPGKGADRAYRLLRDALEQAELAGIAAYSARGKQYVVMVRPFEDGLVMHQLRYPDEVEAWGEVPVGKLPKPAASELGLASKIIDQLRHDTFDPGRYVATRTR